MKRRVITNEKNKQINYKIIYNQDGTFNRIKILKDVFENKEKNIQKIVSQNIKEYISDYAYIEESNQKVYFDKNLVGEYTYSKATNNMNISYKLAKGRAVIVLKELIFYAKNRLWESNRKDKHRVDAKYGFYRYNTVFSFEYNGKEKMYQGTILIRNDQNGKKYLYDILNIKKIGSNLPLVVSNS